MHSQPPKDAFDGSRGRKPVVPRPKGSEPPKGAIESCRKVHSSRSGTPRERGDAHHGLAPVSTIMRPLGGPIGVTRNPA
jgi:hypothetical protein